MCADCRNMAPKPPRWMSELKYVELHERLTALLEGADRADAAADREIELLLEEIRRRES